MAKEINVVCNNVFKSSSKDEFKLEFNKKLIQVIKESEKNKSCINLGKIR
ncbi:hypothetical protein [Anaerovorax odorimutans]|nr:hypothetical protein [Anaerovorax odorimutans]